MVVKIRLSRWGASNHPFYGIVVANARAPRDRKFLERVGTYNPIPDGQNVKHIELNTERIKYWLGVGAQPTERVAWLLAKAALMPSTPKQLHNIGVVDLNDKRTWKVQVIDVDGKPLALLESDQAFNDFQDTPLGDQLPTDPKAIDPNFIQVSASSIKWDQKPKEALTSEETLYLLKNFLKIS